MQMFQLILFLDRVYGSMNRLVERPKISLSSTCVTSVFECETSKSASASKFIGVRLFGILLLLAFRQTER